MQAKLSALISRRVLPPRCTVRAFPARFRDVLGETQFLLPFPGLGEENKEPNHPLLLILPFPPPKSQQPVHTGDVPPPSPPQGVNPLCPEPAGEMLAAKRAPEKFMFLNGPGRGVLPCRRGGSSPNPGGIANGRRERVFQDPAPAGIPQPQDPLAIMGWPLWDGRYGMAIMGCPLGCPSWSGSCSIVIPLPGWAGLELRDQSQALFVPHRAWWAREGPRRGGQCPQQRSGGIWGGFDPSLPALPALGAEIPSGKYWEEAPRENGNSPPAGVRGFGGAAVGFGVQQSAQCMSCR